MKLREALTLWGERWKSGDEFSQKRQLEDLIGHTLNLSWSQIQMQKERELKVEELETFKKQAARLIAGEPLAYITEEKFFYKQSFYVNPSVLIPRPETELLVGKALSYSRSKDRVLDLGAGSGCIGLSYALENREADVTLVELSEAALSVIQINQKRLQIPHVKVVSGKVGDESLLTPAKEGLFDLILANPPYIAQGDSRVENSAHEHEPHLALYCGDEGLECIKSWLHWSWPRLAPGGTLIFEFGEGQERQIADFIKSTDYSIIELVTDYSQIKRFYVLKK